EDGARYLANLQNEPDPGAFFRMGVHVEEGIGEIISRTGDLGNRIRKAETLAVEQELSNSADIYLGVKEETSDKHAKAFAARRAIQLRRQADFKAGQWVDLVPTKDLREWWVHYGDWSVSKKGHLVGKSNLEGMLLVRKEDFGVHYTLKGRVRFVKSHFTGANAGIFFGKPMEHYRRLFPYRPATAFRFYEGDDYAVTVIRYQEHKKKLPVESVSNFRIERLGDLLTTYLDGRLVNESIALNLTDDEEERFAIGGYYWYLGTVLEFQQLRIRSNPKTH
ncbi:MAG: DUF1080 domain-containing protein, partial [Pirellulales bacterium]|nr:DUF1080 domain-containing protein [Pirellulales bacterium]